MEDFLLSAIDFLQEDLQPEEFLKAVLGEIKGKLLLQVASGNASASFQSKAVAEVRRRVEIEKELRAEIGRLSEVVLCAENSERSLKENISRVEHQHALDLDEGNKKVLLLTEQRDLAMSGERAAKSKLDNATKSRDQLECNLRAEILRLKDQHANTCENSAAELQVVNQQWEATLRSQRESKKATLRFAVTFCKEKALRDLEKLNVQNSDLVKEVDGLQGRNNDLEHQICALKNQNIRSPIVRRSRRGLTDEAEQSDSDLDDSASDYRVESEPAGKSKAAAGRPQDRGLPDDILTLLDGSICDERRKPLDESNFVGSLPKRGEIAIFSRSLLSAQLGGGKISLRVNISPGNKKRLAQRLGINSYVCPNLDHNPWAPSSPGKAGFMFVGLGNEQGAFAMAEKHEMFVQFAPKRMFYAGRYLCKKVEDLGPEEWEALDNKVKYKYCETTDSKTNKGKEKNKSRVETIMSEYNEGTRRVPCVFLQCVDYNWALYNALADTSKHVDLTPSRRAAAPSSQIGHSKRKRTVEDLDDPVPETPSVHETTQGAKKARNTAQETQPHEEEEVSPDDTSGSGAGNSDQSPILVD